MIKSCISDFVENYFSKLVVKPDLILAKVYMSICKDALLMKPCTLYDLYSCKDSDECCYAILNILRYKFYHFSNNMGFTHNHAQ